MDWQNHLPALLVVAPLAGAFLFPLIAPGGRTFRRLGVLLSAAVVLVLTGLLWHKVATEGTLLYVIGGANWNLPLPPGLSFPPRIILVADAFSMIGLAGPALLFLAGAFAWTGEAQNDSSSEGLSGMLYLLAYASIVAMTVTGDFFSLVLFFGLFSLCLAGLTALSGREQALKTAFEGLHFWTVFAVLALFGLALIYGRHNTVNMSALAGVLQFGLVEKVALGLVLGLLLSRCGAFPLHFPLFDYLQEALPSTACLLIAGAQGGVYSLMRVLFSIYGSPLGSAPVGWGLILSGVFAVVFGLVLPLLSRSLKALPAFVFLVQVGTALLGIGAGLVCLADVRAMADFGMTALRGGVAQVVLAFPASALLFLVSAFLFSDGPTAVVPSAGVRRRLMPFFLFAAWLLAGLPPFVGYVPKLLLHESLFALNPMLGALSLSASVAMAALLTRASYVLAAAGRSSDGGSNRLSLGVLLSLGLLVTLLFALSFLSVWMLSYVIDPAINALLDQGGYMTILRGGGM
jgi:multicomponent Na+:H+ antiporter subunit D